MGKKLKVIKQLKEVVTVNGKSVEIKIEICNMEENLFDLSNRINLLKSRNVKREVHTYVSIMVPFSYEDTKYILSIHVGSQDMHDCFNRSFNNDEILDDVSIMNRFSYDIEKYIKETDSYKSIVFSINCKTKQYIENGQEYFMISTESIKSSFDDKRVRDYKHIDELMVFVNEAMKYISLKRIKRIFVGMEGM